MALAGLRARLGPLLEKAQSSVQPMVSKTEKLVGGHYNAFLESNKEYIVKDSAAADKLLRQWLVTNVSRWADGGFYTSASFRGPAPAVTADSLAPRLPEVAEGCKADWSYIRQKGGDLSVPEVSRPFSISDKSIQDLVVLLLDEHMRSLVPDEVCLCVQVGNYLLFAAEVYAWFAVGEIVGRGFTFDGYHV